MTKIVEVPYGDDAASVAVLLLEAAEKAKAEPSVVQTTSDGLFLVPEEIAKSAGVDYESDDDDEDAKPAKKTAAKKTASSK